MQVEVVAYADYLSVVIDPVTGRVDTNLPSPEEALAYVSLIFPAWVMDKVLD